MRYLIGLLITAGLIILLIVLLVSGGGNNNKVPTTNKPLDSYAGTDAQTIMTIDGPVNADQSHTQVRITVAQDSVTYQKLSGYDGKVSDSKTYPNTQASYASFLKSLGHAGFTLGDNAKSLQDERGYCALGNRYIFELDQGGSQIERYWTSSCGKPKTYLGVQSLTISLFEAQVPDFSNLETGLSI